jgi:uncharacterized protein with GYD domain
MGIKTLQEHWPVGAYDFIYEAPDDETMSAFILKVSSLGKIKGQTLRVPPKRDGRDSLKN